ncbi:SOS response-associated peptidase [Novosphingobium soli]|uniref:SOS response-associated peptidase n=1 Tax=Novosphingobium soli TaxID=574956 RepID=UPI0036D31C1A
MIEDAIARSEGGGVERTWGDRLALEILIHAEVAEAWQAREFWNALAWQSDVPGYEVNACTVQRATLFASLNSWCERLGRRPIDPVELRRIARPYLPDLDCECGTPQLPCMCNRYKPGEREMIRSIFDARLYREINEGPPIVHPKEPGWVVRLLNGERVLDQMTWGFPVYLRGKAGQPLKPRPVNNARFDKIDGFWKRWAADRAQRCLIPAVAYAEAEGRPGAMTTTWLSVKDAPLFAWAGLWRETDEWDACYTGVMTENAPELYAVHDRSPVILAPEDWNAWLTEPLDALLRFDRPWPAKATVVSRTPVLWKDGGRMLE